MWSYRITICMYTTLTIGKYRCMVMDGWMRWTVDSNTTLAVRQIGLPEYFNNVGFKQSILMYYLETE